MRKLLSSFLISLAFAGAAQADSWLAAQVQAKASANGQFVVRVVPGNSMGDVNGFAGLPKGPYATAEWHKFNGTSYVKTGTATLLNPVAPVDIVVTNSGSLITIDNWHNLGFGSVVAIYSAGGQLEKKYSLSDLYSRKDLARIEPSVSSIHWRCRGYSTFLENETELWISDSIGGRFVFNLLNKTFEYHRGQNDCK